MKQLRQKDVGIFLVLGVLLFLLPMTVWAGEDIPDLWTTAKAGNTKAQYNLELIYDSRGETKYYMKAAHWFRLAANKGDAFAQNNLGVDYATSRGVLQDYVKAAHWFRLAANQGFPFAQNNLGVCYVKGLGVPQDYVKAAHWFRLAANKGVGQARYNLGVCYYNGQGVPQDYVKAAHWFRLAR